MPDARKILGNIDDPPPVLATLPPMQSALPQLDAPVAPSINVDPRFSSGNAADPLANRASDVSADLYNRTHPLAPTTALGKIGHIAANIGNVLGNIFAPAETALIPHSQLNNEIQNQRDRSELEEISGLQNQQAQRAQTEAQTAYTEQRPDIEKAKILQKLTSSLAPKGIKPTLNPDGSIDVEDDPTSQAYQNQQSLAAMHDATAEKDAIQSEIAQNHYVPGTPEYNEAQRKLAQVDKRLGVAMAGLGLRQQSLQLRRNDQQANFYGLGPDGRPLPNAPQFEDSDGNVVTGGLKGAGRAVDQQTKVVSFNDLRGSVQHVRDTLQDLYKSGGSLSDASTIAAFSDPESMTGKFIKGKLVQPSLSPQQVAAVNAINQLHEQASILRKTTGGTAAEAQAQRILETVPQSGDANNVAPGKLDEVDSVLNRLAPAAPNIAGGAKVRRGAPSTSENPSEGTTKTNSAGDKIVFRGGKWGPA